MSSLARHHLHRVRYAVVVAITACVLAACGGGSADQPGSSSLGVSEGPKSILSNGVGAGEAAWTLCANEGQTCVFDGTREVRYGTSKSNVVATFSDQVACTNAVFGDPVPGTVKSCWYANGGGTKPVTTWVACADENQFCAFSGTRAVRYGAGSTFYMGAYTNGVRCSNSVFGDPLEGVGKSCSYAANEVVAAPEPTPPVGASGSNPPVVFNASGSVHAGDVVSLQGDRFGPSPRVYLDGAAGTPLEIVNRSGDGWLAVQIPAAAQSALVLRVANATGISARVVLNGARPLHLDTMQLVPGGPFRIFGRSLAMQGSSPTVTVDGQPATIDLAHSDEYAISATAPAALAANAAAVIRVDNGNGTGAATLDRTIEIADGGVGDPFGLGVGWGAAFVPFSRAIIDAATDGRLPQRVVCDGRTDDTYAIRSAIDLAASLGGGVVRVPAGRCRMANGMELKSRVVVQGAGRDTTELVYESNYPVYGVGIDLSGLGNLTLTNAGSASEGPLLKDSTRVFLQGVRVNLGTSRQMYLTGNRHVVIANSEFIQVSGISGQGPYVLNDSAGLVFENNLTRWATGAPAFGHVHDSYVHASRFSRDASTQNSSDVVHSMTIDFAHRLAVVGNTFDVVNGPIVNHQRNDGEALLTEGGGAARTENLGTVASATDSTMSDPQNAFTTDPFGTGALPENYGVAIVGGTGAGQTRRVVAIGGTTLTVDRPWDVVPDAGSRYATFVWGLEKSLIKDNAFLQNPRGIWLYQTAIRDVDVVGNVLAEGGGIYLRAYQNLATKSFTPIYNVILAGNQVTNSTGAWTSYANAVFVNADARAFGIAMLGIEMRSNAVTANLPNLSLPTEEYAGTEGFANLMRVENYAGYESSSVPRILGSIFTGNSCTNCDVGVHIGTGAGGTTLVNTRLVNSPLLYTDVPTTSSGERATDTVIR